MKLMSDNPATDVVPKLNKEQYDLILYLEQSFWRSGHLPSYEAIVAEGIELDSETYYESWTNPRFLDALRGRGIPEHLLPTASGTFRGRVLTEQQMLVANVLLDTMDKRSRLKKLTELGVSTTEYSSWLKDPVYRKYCLDRAEGLLLENQPTAHMSLIDRVAQGDLGAIKYFNSMTGRYRERQSAAVEVNVQNNYGTDTLIQIVEIIQRHVKDPEVLAALGDEILALQHNRNGGAVGAVSTGVEGIPEFRNPRIIEGKVDTYGIG
jgi:hypothetical protein